MKDLDQAEMSFSIPACSERWSPGKDGEPPTLEIPHAFDTLRMARMNLARIIEASDLAGLILLEALGPETLWRTLRELAAPTQALRRIFTAAHQQHFPHARVPNLDARFDAWRGRLDGPSDAALQQQLGLLGAWVVIPEDPDWPAGFDDLGLHRPIAVWGSGNRARLAGAQRSVAIVGSRNASTYGGTVTREFTYELAGQGWCVVSGGALGIDAVAHRSALQVAPHEPATIAILACGIDRVYPRANAELLSRIKERGLILTELPPGSSPTRYRFLQRNRLIAALTRATVVTEAAWRSGSLNTAHHAESLSRLVAAVPGDVTTGGSAGCHRLIREDHAVLVTHGAEALELLGAVGNDATSARRKANDLEVQRPEDAVPVELMRLFEALPVRSETDASHLCQVSGLGPVQVLAGLTRLRELGFAQESLLGWRRVSSRS